MNRADQLIQALESCLESELPENTEILVFDNASSDNTAKTVEGFKNFHPHVDIKYHLSEENLGVGGGRSAAFELAEGEIVYFLDDDAVISDNSKKDFFIKSVEIFENNPEIASLTTNIYDELLKYDRDVSKTSFTIAGLPVIFNYLGGSHFLRKEYFDLPLYFNIKYGSEEYAPSITVQDKGYYNVFNKDLCIIHKPKENKWVAGSEQMKNIHINGCANIYATKKILYPLILRPAIWVGYFARCLKYLMQYPGAIKEANCIVKALCRENKGKKKIKFSTIIKFYKMFGKSAF